MMNRDGAEGWQMIGAAEAPADAPQADLNPDRGHAEFGAEDALGQHPRRAFDRGDVPAALLKIEAVVPRWRNAAAGTPGTSARDVASL